MAAFILAELVNGNPTGQEACLQRNIISICLDQLDNGVVLATPRLRQWVAICLGKVFNFLCDIFRLCHAAFFVYCLRYELWLKTETFKNATFTTWLDG